MIHSIDFSLKRSAATDFIADSVEFSSALTYFFPLLLSKSPILRPTYL